MAFRRPSRGSEPLVMRRDALESRVDRGMRAYVTSGLVPTRAKRHACALRPHAIVCRARWLATHERREGLRAHTAGWRRSRVRLGWTPATPALFCRAGYSGGNAQGSGRRDGPRRFDGYARRKHAHGQSRRSATLTLLDVRSTSGAERYCYGRVAPSRPEQRTTLLGLLKVSRSRLA